MADLVKADLLKKKKKKIRIHNRQKVISEFLFSQPDLPASAQHLSPFAKLPVQNQRSTWQQTPFKTQSSINEQSLLLIIVENGDISTLKKKNK